VVATGIDAAASMQPNAQAPAQAPAAVSRAETFTLVPGSRPPGVRPVAAMPSPVAPMAVPRRAGVAAAAAPMVLRTPAASHPSASLGPVPVPSTLDDPEGVLAQAGLPNAEPPRRAAGPVAAAASTVPGVSNGIRRIFQEMTGAGLMRRNHPPPAQQAQPPAATAAQRNADALRLPGATAAQPEEIGLDIPTFLRRQSN
jgi:hypothetical protein